jgi:hypothetical protein
MIISYRDLVDLITEGVRKQLNDKKELMQETVSMWIDPDTDAKIDDRAEAVNMPPGSLAAVYRKGLADWIEHNRFGKGKEQHMHALEDVEAFIHNRNDIRSQFPVEWNRVKNFRIKKNQKEYRHEMEKRRKARVKAQKKLEQERARRNAN